MKGWITLVARAFTWASPGMLAVAYGGLFATLVAIAVVESPGVAFALGAALVLRRDIAGGVSSC